MYNNYADIPTLLTIRSVPFRIPGVDRTGGQLYKVGVAEDGRDFKLVSLFAVDYFDECLTVEEDESRLQASMKQEDDDAPLVDMALTTSTNAVEIDGFSCALPMMQFRFSEGNALMVEDALETLRLETLERVDELDDVVTLRERDWRAACDYVNVRPVDDFGDLTRALESYSDSSRCRY